MRWNGIFSGLFTINFIRTYIKTIGCLVEGAIPADDASAIEDIFNKGVRFWKNLNEMGNYSLNNAPT